MHLSDTSPWQAAAACAGLSPNVVFSRRGKEAAPALRACAVCPVSRECEAAVAPAESWFDGVCAGRLWRNGRPVKPRRRPGEAAAEAARAAEAEEAAELAAALDAAALETAGLDAAALDASALDAAVPSRADTPAPTRPRIGSDDRADARADGRTLVGAVLAGGPRG
ncbi:WhiB family transcriptional regulator [Streptomyces roseoviridis]|uniref:WhiB family transcriptional regulator n=1 Tax=Streptomyces roseoviridis TaxID=67361 RepID=A0ABV5QKQ1_9ACTN